jgi:hypothetical protein
VDSGRLALTGLEPLVPFAMLVPLVLLMMSSVGVGDILDLVRWSNNLWF